MKDQVFGVLQRIGRSFMLPIALLPAAGLLLGIGGSFSNVTMLEAYGLTRIMGPGTFWNALFTVMSRAGDIVFTNLRSSLPWVLRSAWQRRRRKLQR